tara:strand:+ start:294 stop:557 length:264 start_codon:yes stop_codon:yes gene_type:complete
MTINEMKKYLETLIENGRGENQVRFMVTDSYKHSNYGVEATFLHDFTTTNVDMKRTQLFFSLNDSDTGEHYDRAKNAKTSPLISFRK